MVSDVRIGRIYAKQIFWNPRLWLLYNSSLWLLMLGWPQSSINSLISTSTMWSTLEILWLITRIALAKILLNWTQHYPLFPGGINSILTRTDFASTWLHPVTFRSRIKNSASSVPKYSKLLANHCGDLRSEGYLHPYPLGTSLDSRAFRIDHVQ